MANVFVIKAVAAKTKQVAVQGTKFCIRHSRIQSTCKFQA